MFSMLILRKKKKFVSKRIVTFLFYPFLSDLWNHGHKKIISLASRAAQPDITHKLFKEQTISIPSKKTQTEFYIKIEKINKSNNELINAHLVKISALEELKKSILQKAFHGELT